MQNRNSFGVLWFLCETTAAGGDEIQQNKKIQSIDNENKEHGSFKIKIERECSTG